MKFLALFIMVFTLSFQTQAEDYAGNKRRALEAMKKLNKSSDEVRLKLKPSKTESPKGPANLNPFSSFDTLKKAYSPEEIEKLLVGLLKPLAIVSPLILLQVDATLRPNGISRKLFEVGYMKWYNARFKIGDFIVKQGRQFLLPLLPLGFAYAAFYHNSAPMQYASLAYGPMLMYIATHSAISTPSMLRKFSPRIDIFIKASRTQRSMTSIAGTAFLFVGLERLFQDLTPTLETNTVDDIYAQAMNDEELFPLVVDMMGSPAKAKAYLRHLFVDKWSYAAILEHDFGVDKKEAQALEERMKSKHPEEIFEEMNEWVMSLSLEKEEPRH